MSEERSWKHWAPIIAAIITSFAAIVASYIGADAKRQVKALEDQDEILQKELFAAREDLKVCRSTLPVEPAKNPLQTNPSAPTVSPQEPTDSGRSTVRPEPSVPSQEVDDVAITITGVHLSGDVLTFDFQVLNKAPGDKDMNLFGEGSFGNGGSRFIADGQEYAATGIRVGNETREGIVGKRFVSGVPLNGYVAFKGVPRNLRSVAVLELAYSYSNLRPAGSFRFSDLGVN